MTQSNRSDPGCAIEAKLPRRDWIVLPMLSLLTILLLALSFESTTWWLFPSSESGLDACFVKDDPSGNAGPKPNSVCSERIVESRLAAEYRFNSCGHRAGVECGPKTQGTYRIVMIGSSVAMGLFVPREKTFAALLPAELSQQTGRKIEIYNESMGGRFRGGAFPTKSSAPRFKEALEANPDMILWILTPMDIENASFDNSSPAQPPSAEVASVPGEDKNRFVSSWNKLQVAFAAGTLEDKVRDRWEETKASVVLKHMLYESESQDQYVKSYLQNEDEAGFLKAAPNEKWQRDLEEFQVYATEFISEARAAKVPLVAVLVPNRAQAAMISQGEWPDSYDPYKLDDELHTMIVSRGGIYIDILPDFRGIPNPERHYFPVDGHLDAEGHAMISELLDKELVGGAFPPLRVISPPQVALERNR
jgi:hypothetical protein